MNPQCNSATCGQAIAASEDAVYDDRTSAYYCDMDCFYDWADDNSEVVTEFYVRLNLTE